MDTGIKLDGAGNPEHVNSVKEAIVAIFKTARETSMDQATVVEALGVLTKAAGIQGAMISNCSINDNSVQKTERYGGDD